MGPCAAAMSSCKCVSIAVLVLSMGACVPVLQRQRARTVDLQDDRLNEEDGFDALVFYRVKIIDHTGHLKGMSVSVLFEVPEGVRASDPKYQQDKQTWGIAALAAQQGSTHPRGVWATRGDLSIYEGSHVGQVKSGKYDWRVILDDSKTTLVVKMNYPVSLNVSSINCLGEIVLDIESTEWAKTEATGVDTSAKTKTRVIHDRDPSASDMLRGSYTHLQAKFKDAIVHLEAPRWSTQTTPSAL